MDSKEFLSQYLHFIILKISNWHNVVKWKKRVSIFKKDNK